MLPRTELKHCEILRSQPETSSKNGNRNRITSNIVCTDHSMENDWSRQVLGRQWPGIAGDLMKFDARILFFFGSFFVCASGYGNDAVDLRDVSALTFR